MVARPAQPGFVGATLVVARPLPCDTTVLDLANLATIPIIGHMYRILVWCPLLEDDAALLRAQGFEVERLVRPETMEASALAAHVRGFDALMVGLDPVTAEMLAGGRLKVVARFGIGVDSVDLEAATGAGVMVTNTPGASKVGVAELAIGLMFSLARRLPQHHALTRAGNWPGQVGFELSGKTLGLVGLGQVGKEVARRACCLGMLVIAHDIVWDSDFAGTHEIDRRSLEEVLSQSDFVSLHVPSTPGTIGLLGEKQLGMMKEGAMLINTARGNLIDEEALHSALISRHLGGAALDVFASEPPAGSPLLDLDHVIFSPHQGGETAESLQNYSHMCTENVLAALRGDQPPNLVNPQEESSP